MNEEFLLQANGIPWTDDDGNKVPANCPKCECKMKLVSGKTPVFQCESKTPHVFGTYTLKIYAQRKKKIGTWIISDDTEDLVGTCPFCGYTTFFVNEKCPHCKAVNKIPKKR